MTRQVWARCPGSCGELFQVPYLGQELLLSYAINRYSTVRIKRKVFSERRIPLMPKMAQALKQFEQDTTLQIAHATSIPLSKGYSSSTADILAALYACSYYQGRKLSAVEATQRACRIEPTDSLAFKNWTVINPLTGQVIWETDWHPTLGVYILEPCTRINTLEVERQLRSSAYSIQSAEEIFPLFQKACQDRDYDLLGYLATLSGKLNNQRLPKPFFNELETLIKSFGFLGINVAHSGTVLGILLRPDQKEDLEIFEKQIANNKIGHYYKKRYYSSIYFKGIEIGEDEL